MNLSIAFACVAAKHAKKTAVFCGEQEYSYEVILAQSQQLAAHLQQALGVKPADRVGLWLKNCPEFISSLFAVLQSGAVVVPINNFLKLEEVDHILADAGIDVIITDATTAEQQSALRKLRPQIRVWGVDGFANLDRQQAGSRSTPNAKLQPASASCCRC